ncbi:MAG: hypothetical protein H0Z34_02770 [Brevibacillus sp.]|nr:hypothetical protein [Brevibacillus sp.]
MIKIDLSKMSDSTPAVRITVSPLFEMAASLHTLTQVLPTLHHHQWVKKSMDIMKKEGIYAEWLYFFPLFCYAIPSLFAVHRTESLQTEEEQFTYLAELPLDQFVQSLQESLQSSVQRTAQANAAKSLLHDLWEEPELTRGRFNLFVSAYIHYIFKDKWESFQSIVSRERLRFATLRSPQAACLFLQEIFPFPIQLDPAEVIYLPLAAAEQGAAETKRIALHPSWFMPHPPQYTQSGDTLHVTYGLIHYPIEQSRL